MKKEIVGILVCTLLIAAAVLPVAGVMTIDKSKIKEKILGFDDAKVSSADDVINPEPLATKTGYLSIPAAAFEVKSDSDTYTNLGYEVYGAGSKSLIFSAPVQLPHEATVTKVTFYWKDISLKDGSLKLMRNLMDGTTENMAEVTTVGNSGVGSSYDDTIDYAEIDNSLYSYFLEMELFGEIVSSYGAIIEYTYESGGSSEDMAGGEESQVRNVAVR